MDISKIPVTIDKYMELALTSYHDSYYQQTSSIGADFITAPEVSQMFGETIALWLISAWEEIGRGDFCIVELGPGNGTLMHDLLRTVKKIMPECFARIRNLMLLEVSPSLRKKQLSTLHCMQIKVSHISSLQDLCIPLELPVIIFANEFLDALPIKQYQKRRGKWYELAIFQKQLVQLEIKQHIQKGLSEMHEHATDGAIVEISEARSSAMKSICSLLQSSNGAALLIDYGYAIPPDSRLQESYISTLQAVKNHEYTDIFEVGADLTAHVDFHDLIQKAQERGMHHSYLTQQQFLLQWGIAIRYQHLQIINPHLKDELKKQYEKLTRDMGSVFKVLVLENF